MKVLEAPKLPTFLHGSQTGSLLNNRWVSLAFTLADVPQFDLTVAAAGGQHAAGSVEVQGVHFTVVGFLKKRKCQVNVKENAFEKRRFYSFFKAKGGHLRTCSGL